MRKYRSQILAAVVLAFAIATLGVATPSLRLISLISHDRRFASRLKDGGTSPREITANRASSSLFSLSAQASDPPESKQHAHFTIYRTEAGEIVCRAATDEEVRRRQIDVERLGLVQINHSELKSTPREKSQSFAGTGLTIILRATQQLQQNQAAVAAFTRAAQNWETLIMSPVTIYIDVDFGTTYFGQTWPNGVLGATNAPTHAYPYDSARTNLVAEANGEGNSTKQAIFNALPSTALPTDLGSSRSTVVSDPAARAIGLLPPTAGSTDPAAQIGFNSSFNFDFDPSDGITAGQIDFDAVATHEIGHALGFHSEAGFNLPRPAVWDLYRFRTGATVNTFTTAQRILTIGGSPNPLQYFFVPGNAELGLSTGGPAGSTANGGDGWQSSHWKHVSGCTPYIGIMAPAIPSGCRRTITSNDVSALSVFGYNLTNNAAPPPPPPAPPPANDNFANAQAISGCTGNTTGTNFSATSEPGEPGHAPNDANSLSPIHTVWYQWQAPASVTTTITTAGSDFDTILAVYAGASLGSLTRITSNDDAKPEGVLTSRVTFNAIAGNTYQIAVDGWGGDSGGVKLNWNGCNVPPPPVNDNFANRQTISGCAGSLSGATFGAGSETNEPTHDPSNPASHSPGHTVWFKWALPTGSPGTMTVTTQGSDFDTILAVYIDTGDLASLIRTASNDDSQSGILTSSVTFNANPGTTYAIVVDGWDGDSGNLQLNWNQMPCATPTPTPTPIPCPTSFTVNDNGDADDATSSDAKCLTSGGVCTLRAAITQADLLPSCGLIDIYFSGVTGVISLNNGLYINHRVNINGPGANVLTVMRSAAQGTPQFGIMFVDFEGIASISGLTVSNGFDSLHAGGGIHNQGIALLKNVTVIGNRTSEFYSGGGVANVSMGVASLPQMTIVNSTITDNQTLATSHSYATGGGGIANSGTLTIINSTISGNKTGEGWAGNNFGNGGGILNGGVLNLTNSTISGNQTKSGSGGGIYNISTNNVVVNFKNTLIANNTVAAGFSGPDLFGPVNSQDFNAIGNTSGAILTGSTAHNITNTNPLLGSLGNNGGPVITHALLAGSPAINAGSNALAVDQNGSPLTMDQRGLSRIVNNTVDIGAFEFGAALILFTDTTNRVIAIDSVTFVRDPFSVSGWHNFSSDQRARVMIFTSTLSLTQPAADLSVTAGGIPLTVEAVGPLSGVPDVSYIIVKLDPVLTGNVSMIVTFHSVTSNAGIISISP